MPLYDNLLTQAGGRQPGGPVARPVGQSSTSLQPSRPGAPVSPSIPAGVVGRPSSRPAMPSGPVGGLRNPRTPAAPEASPAAPPPAGPPSQPAPPVADPKAPFGAPPPATPPKGPFGQPQPQPPGQAPVTNNFSVQYSRIPTRSDLAGLLPGVQVQTPYGTTAMGADGEPVHTFASPESEARYRQDEASYAARYGPTPLASFPGAPTPRVRMGRPAFNPFTGSWLSPEGQR